MKVVVTGFDPFGGEEINPAFEAVKKLPAEIAGAEIIKVEVPTVFGTSGEKVAEAIETHQPDMVICVGQAGGRQINDCLTTVEAITEKTLETDVEEPFFEGSFSGAFITKVEYPADIKMGIEELLRFKKSMGAKLGIKSESIARMSITYYDVSASDNIEGFPAAKFSFLNKYKKMRWG
ncbi:MAG: pyroglutamyl-peptidase I family protein [Enterococcus faecalis]